VDPKLRYPLYVIANRDGVLVVNHDGDDCILLFHSQPLAQRHIDETKTIGATASLVPLAIPHAAALREGLESLPSDITCAIWDATLMPHRFVRMGIDELLEALEAS
jgi:hypothetical protein